MTAIRLEGQRERNARHCSKELLRYVDASSNGVAAHELENRGHHFVALRELFLKVSVVDLRLSVALARRAYPCMRTVHVGEERDLIEGIEV